MANFTFEYRPITETAWFPKARTWKTLSGAINAGKKWAQDMEAEGCPVQIRHAQIIDNRPVVISTP